MGRSAGVVVLAAVMLWSAPASAATKACDGLRHARYGKVVQVRVTTGFSCRDARSDLRRWLAAGAPGGPSKRELRPWTCDLPGRRISTYRSRISCRLRTSFGGTRPERTYALTFVYDLRS